MTRPSPKQASRRCDSPVSVVQEIDIDSPASTSPSGSSNKSGQQRLKVDRKSVRFAREGDNMVVHVSHYAGMSQRQKAALWFDAGDYAKIKASCLMTIAIMEAGEKPTLSSGRGLEARTSEGSWERLEFRRAAADAVLDQQDRNWDDNVDDDAGALAIAEAYKPHSRACAGVAAARAAVDEKEAAEILQPIVPPRRVKKQQQQQTKKRNKP